MSTLLYEPDEHPPYAIAFGISAQRVMAMAPSLVLIPTIIMRAAEQDETYLAWAIFAMLMVNAATTVLQTFRIGRVGSGYPLVMVTSSAFIGVCISALSAGGPSLMATLLLVSAGFQFALATRLSLLRRFITPMVTGTLLVLIAISIMPAVFRMLTTVPDGTPWAAAPASAAVTFATVVALLLRASEWWRLWAPLIGITVGCAVAAPFGLYDPEPIGAAPWIGFPLNAWPGVDLTFGPAFWSLLPAFLFVMLIGTTGTLGHAVSTQQVSWRRQRATDLRSVQGAVATVGVSNLLCGLAGTIPTGTAPSSAPFVEQSGVAACRVAVCVGILFFVLAFLPKVMAVLIAIPSPVAAAYLAILFGPILVQGMQLALQSGNDSRKTLIISMAVWVGIGFESQAIFSDYLSGMWEVLLGNGITAGGLMVVGLTAFMELTGARRRRLEIELGIAGLPKLTAFLRELAARLGWSEETAQRLCLIGEEALTSLIQQMDAKATEHAKPRLRVLARQDGAAVELEFMAAVGEENLEDHLALLGEQAETLDEREFSLRLLRHFASSVRHQQYHNIDIVTVRVDGPRSSLDS